VDEKPDVVRGLQANFQERIGQTSGDESQLLFYSFAVHRDLHAAGLLLLFLPEGRFLGDQCLADDSNRRHCRTLIYNLWLHAIHVTPNFFFLKSLQESRRQMDIYCRQLNDPCDPPPNGDRLFKKQPYIELRWNIFNEFIFPSLSLAGILDDHNRDFAVSDDEYSCVHLLRTILSVLQIFQ
jgi:hypothetical protein